jgi:hypothetical protein
MLSSFVMGHRCGFVIDAVLGVSVRHFRNAYQGGSLKARKPVPVGLFAGKYEKERRPKVEFRQAVNQQWIMFVGRVPTYWSKNFTKALTETVPIHVSERVGSSLWAQRRSMFAWSGKHRLTRCEGAAVLQCNAAPIGRMALPMGHLSDHCERLPERDSIIGTR